MRITITLPLSEEARIAEIRDARLPVILNGEWLRLIIAEIRRDAGALAVTFASVKVRA